MSPIVPTSLKWPITIAYAWLESRFHVSLDALLRKHCSDVGEIDFQREFFFARPYMKLSENGLFQTVITNYPLMNEPTAFEKSSSRCGRLRGPPLKTDFHKRKNNTKNSQKKPKIAPLANHHIRASYVICNVIFHASVLLDKITWDLITSPVGRRA
jgi:hypothetical protein